MASSLNLHRIGWSILAGLSVVYSVATLAYVATAPDLRLRSLLTNNTGLSDPELSDGIEIRSVDGMGPCHGSSPAPGDRLISLAGVRTHTFVDLCRAMASLRTREREITRDALLAPGTNASEDRMLRDSTLSVVKVQQGPVLAKAVFIRAEPRMALSGWTLAPPFPGTLPTPLPLFSPVESVHVGWIPFEPQPMTSLTVSMVWFVLQLIVLVVAGIAYWHRPYDRPLRLFLITALMALVAFIGGSHWWVIAGNLWLLIPFAVAALLLPAVLLHFFLVYPLPRRWLTRHAGLVLAGIYAIPVLAAVSTLGVILAGSWLTTTGTTPLGQVLERFGSQRVGELLPWLQWGVTSYLPVAAGYFLLSLGSLGQVYFGGRRGSEHDQVRWILAAASLATVPLGYAWLKVYQQGVEIVFGGAQAPLFAASLLFTAAYAIGIVRYRLMLIDQVLNRGLLYYVISFTVTVVFSLIVAVGATTLLGQGGEVFGQPVLVFVVAVVAVIMLLWLRDGVQRGVDREFFREKYRLDKALQKVNQAVMGLMDRRTLAERILASCQDVLQTDRGAIYLRNEQSRTFLRLANVGSGQFPVEFSAPREFVETLRSGLSLQRTPGGNSPIQETMRGLDAELVHGLDVDGELAGLVALGSKPNAATYNAEDAAFLSAIGRVAGVTLHFGKVHEELSRMNAEFSRLNHELEERTTQMEQLRDQLRMRDEALAQRQRQIESLQHQLSLRLEGTPVDRPAPSEAPLDAPTILGRSPAIRSVLETVRKVAPTEASVLVRGESGTGKELLARAIHDNSPRRNGPLVTLHCAALAPGVLESELFGHVRGAFTDARQDKLGRFQLASGGTLFLDEIGDVPLETQVKLLRVLQERVIEPVGSSQPIPVDVRLIAATHRNLETFIAEGRFREDLYYRLNVVSITLPPLRDRGDDIVELAVQFLRRASERTGKPVTHFDEEVLERFRAYAWPGNIRELENVVERAVVLADGTRLTLEDLPPALRSAGTSAGRAAPSPRLAARTAASADGFASEGDRSPSDAALKTDEADAPWTLVSELGTVRVVGSEEERQLLKEALVKARGNKARAARLLGLPRSTYFSKLRKHGLG